MPDDHEIIHLPSAGSIPGFPGLHGPGRYLVSLAERTIARLEDVLAESQANLEQHAAVAGVVPTSAPEEPQPAEAQPEPDAEPEPAAAEAAQPEAEPAPDEAQQ